jgi:hypothetical protein
MNGEKATTCLTRVVPKRTVGVQDFFLNRDGYGAVFKP